MQTPYQFAGNEEMYHLAVKLYLTDVAARTLKKATDGKWMALHIADEIASDMEEVSHVLL